MSLFSLSAATPRPMMPERNDNFTDARVAAFEEACAAKVATVKKHLRTPPTEGQVQFVWTTAAFNTMSLIIWLIEALGPVDELVLSTYSISNICVQTLLNWIDAGKIAWCHLYLSDYVPRMSPKKYDFLTSSAAARPGKMKIGLGFNHSKVTLAAIGNNRIVITGSGNFAENSGNEQYTICNNAQIYEFFKACITEDHPVRYRADRIRAAGGTEVGP